MQTCSSIRVLLCISCCLTAAHWPQCEAAEADPELRVRLWTPKSAYVYGENITLHVEIENTTEEEVDIALSSDLLCSHNDLLCIALDEKDPVPLSGRLFMSADVVCLNARQSLGLRYSWFFLRPGEHKLSLVYAHKPSQVEEQDPDGLWRGRVRSNEIKIEVIDRPMTGDIADEFNKRLTRLRQGLQDEGPETRTRVVHVMMQYMPLTKDLMRHLMADPDPGVRLAVVSGLAFHCDKTYCEEADLDHDISLVPDMILRAGKEPHPNVRIWLAIALGNASESLQKNTRQAAGETLEQLMEDNDPVVAGRAAISLLAVDSKRAARAIRKKVAENEQLDPQFLHLLRQGVREATGESDIAEGLKELAKEKKRSQD